MPETGPGRNFGNPATGAGGGGGYVITGDVGTPASAAAYGSDIDWYTNVLTGFYKPNVTPALAESFYQLLSKNLRGIIVPGAAQEYRFDLTDSFEDVIPRIGPLQPGSRKSDLIGTTVLGEHYDTVSKITVGEFLAAKDTVEVDKDVTWYNQRIGAYLSFAPKQLFDSLYQSRKLFADPDSKKYYDWNQAQASGLSFGGWILQTAVRVLALVGIAYGVGTLSGSAVGTGTGAGGGGAGAVGGGSGGAAAVGAGAGGAGAGAAAGAGGGGGGAATGGVVGGALGSANSAVTGSVDSQVATTNAATVSAIGGIVNDVQGFVSKVDDFLSPFLKSVKDITDSISKVVSTINDGLIKPILDPITSIVTEVGSLKDFISTDLKGGILGILKIPGDISNALTSIDATMQRSILQLAAQQAQVLDDGLKANGPSMGLTGQTKISESLDAIFPKEGNAWRPPQRITLEHNTTIDTYREYLAKLEALVSNPQTWYGHLLKDFLTAFELFLSIPAQAEPMMHAIGDIARTLNPTEKFGAGDVARLWAAKMLNTDDAKAELLKNGYDEEHAALILEGARKFVGVGDVVTWMQRGQLTETEAREYLSVLNFADEDIDRIINTAPIIPAAADVLNWWHRGLLDDAGADEALKAAGYDAGELERVKLASFVLPAVGDWIAAMDREPALQQDPALSEALNTPPAVFVDALRRLGISTQSATLLWSNHYQLLPPQQAIASYFRGFINRQQVYAYLKAYGFAPAVLDNLIDSQRPQIEYRSIPQLVRLGIIDAAAAKTLLQEHGYNDRDIVYILQIAGVHAVAAQAPDAALIKNDTQAVTIALYNQGSITRPEASSSLKTLGYTPEAVNAILSLEDIKATAARHKLEVDTVIAQVQSGTLSVSQAQAALAQYGLTTAEMAAATTKLNQMMRTKTKLPGEAQLFEMYSVGILPRDVLAGALELSGYSSGWAELLIQAYEAKHGIPNKS